MILVDTSVWINYFNGVTCWQTELLDELLSDTSIMMGDLILLEILQGFRSDKDYTTAKSHLSVLPFRQMGGYDVVVQSACNYRVLRKKGVTIRKTIDVLIATFCMMNELSLLHDDHDFDSMKTHLPLHVVVKDSRVD